MSGANNPEQPSASGREDAPTLAELIRRLERADGPSRDLDRALTYVAGIGTDLERAFYAERGDEAFAPDQHGLTPMDYKNGDRVREEWVKGTRCHPGGYKPRIWLNCNGPRPLRSAPAYTASLDEAVKFGALFDAAPMYVLWPALVGGDPHATADRIARRGLASILKALRQTLPDGAPLRVHTPADGEGPVLTQNLDSTLPAGAP